MANPVPVGLGLLVPFDRPDHTEPLLALSPCGTRLAVVACEDSETVRVVDAHDGTQIARWDGFDRVQGVEFLSADVLVVVACTGFFHCHLRRGDRSELASVNWPRRATASPTGHLLALGVRGGIDLYDVRKRRVLHRLSTWFSQESLGMQAAFSAGDRYVAAELRDENHLPLLVGIWDIQSGNRYRIFDTGAHALAFRDDTLALALATENSHIHLYEPDQGETPTKTLNLPHRAEKLQFRNDGRTLAALLGNGEVILFNVHTGRATKRVRAPNQPRPLWGSIASADWSRFAGVVEGGVFLWPGDRAPL